MNNDEMDDAEFEAFLKGEGELSSRLQALAQPSPSAELDAAILARATVDAARHARPAAANDAGEADAPTPQLGRLSWRWRVPAGIAATVLVGVVANQTWRANEAAQMEAMSAKAEPAAEVVMVQQVNAPVAEVSALEVSKPVAAAAPRAPAVVAESVASPPPPILEEKSLPSPPPPPPSAAPAVAAVPAPAPVEERDTRDKKADASALRAAESQRADTRLDKEAQQKSSELARQAPAAAAPEKAGALADQAVSVSGRRRAATDGFSQTQNKGIAVVTAPMQLELIEAMLQSGKKREALEEWTRFRAAYPDYPVSQATQDQIKAIKP